MSEDGMEEVFGADDNELDMAAEAAAAVVASNAFDLRDFQTKAVEHALEILVTTEEKRGTSLLLQGGVGSGKTGTADEIIKQALKNDVRTPYKPAIVLIITPSIGGNLPLQWEKELTRQGTPSENVVLFADSKFRRRVADWESRVAQMSDAEVRRNPLYVLVTFHALHADISKVHGASSWLLNTEFEFTVVDEVQFYRNGTHKIKTDDIDPEKKMFNSMMRLRKASPGRCMVLTATPFYNNRCDVYSLIVLMLLANGNKKAWQKDAETAAWKAQKRWFMKNHVVQVKVPPEVARDHRLRHWPPCLAMLGEKEIELTYDAYGSLKSTIEIVLGIMGKISAMGPLPSLLQELDEAMKVMLGNLVRCRRGSQHPAFFDPPIKVTMPNGKEKTLPVPMSRYHDFDMSDCSKFNMVVKMLKKGMSGRVLVTSQFSRPLDFLQVHLGLYLPTWDVVVHHGSTNCVKALQAFADIGARGRNVVMLATAGSCGEGINLSMTTSGGTKAVEIICMDSPYAHAAQQQLEGRIKRPLAQPDVKRWDVHRVNSAARIFPGTARETVHDSVDHALLNVLASKEDGADEVFMSDEELQSQAGKTRASAYGACVREKMAPLLMALMEVTCQWEETEDPQKKVKRRQAVAERKRKREEAVAAAVKSEDSD